MGERPPASRRLLSTLTLLVVGALLPIVAWGGSSTAVAAAEEPGPAPPNIVVILTDDQAEGTMDAMPTVTGQIVDRGATLQGIIPTSICCPSRAALLSGQYARTTGVYENTGINGGWPTFFSSGAESRTIAVALDNAGYHTGMIGKYLNGYGHLAPDGYIPPGWDQFRTMFDPDADPALGAGAYYNYFMTGTGPDVWHGDQPADYSTDVITEESVQFIDTAPSDQPLFLHYATTGPHAPFTPAPRHEGVWPDEPLSLAATTLTKNRPKFWPDRLLPYDKWVAKQTSAHEALMSVDEGVSSVIDALGDRTDNTLFVFLSDNGLQFAEHGLAKKNVPYSGSTEVPMYLRWDAVIPAGVTYDSLTTNADLTATIAEAAGVNMPNLDGVSVFGDRPAGVALESTSSPERPAYCGWRTNRYLYVEYAGKGREFYDYRRDPNELVNVVRADRYQVRVAEHRQAAQAACDPVPPGFLWAAGPKTP